jgi:hypothetical protein
MPRFAGHEVAGRHSHRKASFGATGQEYGINRFAALSRTLAGLSLEAITLTLFLSFPARLHASLFNINSLYFSFVPFIIIIPQNFYRNILCRVIVHGQRCLRVLNGR